MRKIVLLFIAFFSADFANAQEVVEIAVGEPVEEVPCKEREILLCGQFFERISHRLRCSSIESSAAFKAFLR